MHSPNGSPTIRLQLLGAVDARTSGGSSISELVNQSKRLAFISYLALAPDGRARRRDDLLALFFPDSSEGPARNALNQTVYRLRAVLGEDALISNEQEIRINPERVWCDAAEVRAAAAAGDDARVLELYRGSLLDAFHARGTANEFDMWLAREREDLRELAVRSAWRASVADAAAGNLIGAAESARAAVRFAPLQEDSVRRLMLLLESVGDRGGALRAYEDYERRLVEEFELEPAAALSDLATLLRERPAPPLLSAVVFSPAPEAPAKNKWIRPVAVGVAAIVVATVATVVLVRNTTDGVPVLAVGDITVTSVPDTLLPIELLLSTSLARIDGLSVITEERVREVAAQLTRAGRTSRDARTAALRAGASEVIEGVLSLRGQTYRLDFRRVDGKGRAGSGHIVEANDVLDLADLVTEQIAKDLGLRAPASRADGSSASLVAYRLYQQGLNALYADDHSAANRLFRAALGEDSTFAMAAYQLAGVTGEGRETLFAKARALAANSPERERLLITARSMLSVREPGVLPVAESLATRYPRDPEGAVAYGMALSHVGRLMEAVQQYRRAAELDSLSIFSSEPRCGACEARRLMGDAYVYADSLAAAEREARAWVRQYPASPYTWAELGARLTQLEKFDEAERAFQKAPGLRRPGDMTGVWIRQMRFADVDLHHQNELRTGDEDVRKSAHWGMYISMRTQGRLREAMTHALAYKELQKDSLLEAIALLDMGRYRESARIFEAISLKWAGESHPIFARRRSWHLAHAAAGYAGLRDTAMLRLIEDTVRIYGGRSGHRDDVSLHHYVRGLRLRVLGRDREAVAAFEAAMNSAYDGYVREPYELARASLATGNPSRAIQVLRPALLGPLSAVGLYSSRTDLMELLGDAYARNNQPDSAAAVYARVLESWKNADPMMQARVQNVRARLSALLKDR